MAEEAAPTTFGRYRLLRKLATGGMAEIYLAVQQGPHGFEKVVVIKKVLPDLGASSEFVDMFLDEARLAARLDHPNIVRIYDFGELDGVFYLAMEYLAGEDLASVLQQCRRTQQFIPVNLAAEMMIGACEGLHFAHELEDHDGNKLNIVHRDVSPSNIIVTYQGVAKMVDFGIARAETNVVKTNPGTQLKGKIQYLAPEQAKGIALDRRADTFALGIVMHELLTGKRLFQRENQLATLNAVLDVREVIPPPSAQRPEVPPELDAIVLKALNRDVALRYQSAAEMAADLQIFLSKVGHVRGKAVVEFLIKLFGEERRKSKIRVAHGQATLEEVNRASPGSQSRPSFSNLQPVRTDPNGIPAQTGTPARTKSGVQQIDPRPPSQRTPGGSPRPPSQVARPPSQIGGPRPPSTPGGARPPSQPRPPSQVGGSRPPSQASAPPAPQLPEVPDDAPILEPEPATGAELSGAARFKKFAPMGIAGVGVILVVTAVALAMRSEKPPEIVTNNDAHHQNQNPQQDQHQQQVQQDPPPKKDPVVVKTDDKPKDPGLQVGGVKFKLNPAAARVAIDGDTLANATDAKYLPVGTHHYLVEAAGYFPEEADLIVEVGKIREVPVALKLRPVTPKGTVEINCQPWCKISVDGRDTGKTSPARVQINAGTHQLQLTNPPAGLAKTITVKVPADGTVKQVVKLED